MTEEIRKLKELVDGSDNIVFFGGAGVSTESGIPDFRSTDGLYNQEWKYPPEEILSRSFFDRNPEEYYRFHHAKLRLTGAQPNAAHRKLAEWEAEGKLRAVITQNIDKTLSNVIEVKARGARVLAVAFQGDRRVVAQADDTIFIPRVNTLFAAALAVVPMQLLAYYTAKENGCDIDKPKNLAKSVTVE